MTLSYTPVMCIKHVLSMETPIYLGNPVQEFYALECEPISSPFFYSSIVL